MTAFKKDWAKRGRNLLFVVFRVEKNVFRTRNIEKSRKNDMVMVK